jgi:hypothetical protein
MPPSKGGKREGAGRPILDPSGVKRRRVWFFLTEKEESLVRDLIDLMRAWRTPEPTTASAPAPESVAAEPEAKPNRNELEDVETGEAVENSLRSTGTSDWDGEGKEEIDG